MTSYIILGASYLAKATLTGSILYLIIYTLGSLKRGKVNAVKVFFEYIFTVYLVGVCMVTGIAQFSTMELTDSFDFNIIPFQSNSLLLFALNIIMFIPMGSLIPIVFKKKYWKTINILMVGILTSLFIEVVQLMFVGRAADIDDILSNTIGCLIGYFIYKLVNENYKSSQNLGVGTLSLLLNILAAIWGVTFNRLCIGDIFLSLISIPTWSDNIEGVYSFSGMHYASLLTFVFLVPAFLLGYANREDFGAKIGMKLSIISGVFYVLQFIYYLLT